MAIKKIMATFTPFLQITQKLKGSNDGRTFDFYIILTVSSSMKYSNQYTIFYFTLRFCDIEFTDTDKFLKPLF